MEEEVNEFLLQLNDAADAGVLVVGATNYPERIDTAIMRSGRMDKLIYVPPPDYEARKELFKMSLSGRPQKDNIDFDKLSKLTEFFVSSDIELIVDKSARIAVSEDKPISEDMIISVVSNMKPSITQEELKYFQQFENLERW
jgi:transitional endoplasmic reticulum ATPase